MSIDGGVSEDVLEEWMLLTGWRTQGWLLLPDKRLPLNANISNPDFALDNISDRGSPHSLGNCMNVRCKGAKMWG